MYPHLTVRATESPEAGWNNVPGHTAVKWQSWGLKSGSIGLGSLLTVTL